MAKKWRDIRGTFTPAQEAKIKAWVDAESSKIPLAELRRARAMTQQALAEQLHVNQAAVSKLEQRADMYLSTLRSYLEAMGGTLELRAVFPDGEVVLETFSETRTNQIA